jgi:hypothetical protein
MPLPFDANEIAVVEFTSAGVQPFGLPKYESVTPAEELAIIPVLRGVAEALDAESMVRCNQALATIALKRLHPDQSESETGNLPLTLVKELAEFLLNERNGWSEPLGEDSEKKLTGPATKTKSETPSLNSTGDLAPAGPTDSPAKDSPKSHSAKSKPQA